MTLKESSLKLLFFTFLLFVLLFPLSNSVDFMQNDDWVHYRIVEKFLRGDFHLIPSIGSTFYVQGFMGYVFAQIFGIGKLPVLTLLISILNFYVLSLILVNQLKTRVITGILLSLLFFLNPLHFYSIFGFMTDNYFVFFFLLTIYIFKKFINADKFSYFILMNVLMIFGFLVKQSMLIFSVGFLLYFFVKRKFKIALFQGLITALIAIFYYKIFPLTPVMVRQKFLFSNLMNVDYVRFYTFSILIYLVVFLLPIFTSFLWEFYKKHGQKRFSFFIVITFGLLTAYFTYHYFVGKEFGVFPFFPNVFNRKGFFVGGLSGNKYHWLWFYDVFESWYLISLIIACIAIYIFLFKIKSVFKQEIIFILLYTASLLSVHFVFDRYLLPLILLVIMLMAYIYKKNVNTIHVLLLILFIGFLSIINYQFTMDYVSWNKYVWDKSKELVEYNGVVENRILSVEAWNKNHLVDKSNLIYKFSFDAPKSLNDDQYKLLKKHKIDFPFNLYINPYVYLYKTIN